MAGKRGRPPKKIIKHNPMYSRLTVRKVLQDYLITDPCNPVTTQEANDVVKGVLERLDEE